MDEATHAGATGPIDRELGPADVHIEQLPYAPLRMDHRRGVEHGRVVDAVEEPIERIGVPHVADDDFDAGIDDFEQHRVSFVADEAPDALSIGIASRARGRGSDPASPHPR